MSKPFGDSIGSFDPRNIPGTAGGAEGFAADAGADVGADVPGGGAKSVISSSSAVPLPNASPVAGPSQARTL
ncbi:hypothetical protein GCM10009654_17220 [Streptomyces hebeiensis]|uniref:Uncharacterized protein n=1 Tax=Streptomyces hebeiensis TaxID=229486 RepID=A0ABN1URJ6_9ACTN